MDDLRTADELLPELYQQLERMAARIRIGGGRTPLSPSSLVHETWMRIARDKDARYTRAHFCALVARAMRAVAVDFARRSGADKRGGALQQVTWLDVGEDGRAVDLVALDQALIALATEDARVADVVQLRFFGGLGVEEIAAALDVSPRTVKSDWRLGRAWLATKLDLGPPTG